MPNSLRFWTAPYRRQGGSGAPALAEVVQLTALTLTLGGFAACAGSSGLRPATARPSDQLELIEADELHFEGPAGGSFQPDLALCTLRNAGGTDLSWEAESSADWLNVRGPTSGVLRPQASIAIGVAIDPEASLALAVGTHEAELRFQVPGHPGSLHRRRVTLHNEAPPVSGAVGQAGIPTPAFAASAWGDGDAGWTVLSPSPDTHTIYVSSSTGDDGGDGRSPATAKRSIAAGKALLGHRKPDWLLLMRGDTWNEGLGQWTRSGRSPTEPMVVGWYGSAPDRPRLRTGTSDGLTTLGSGGAPPTTENVAFVGLHFQASGYDGTNGCVGARLLQPCKQILIEDCLFEGYQMNLVFQGDGGRHEGLRVRRCVVVDAYVKNGHAHGLYAARIDGLLLEENLFEHNGWNTSVPDAGPNIFSHNLYIQNGNTDVVVRGNIIANASSHGMQLRCGGTAVNNLFLRNSIALSVGGGMQPDEGGVRGLVSGNVILDGKDIDAANPRGLALWLENIAQGQVTGNLIAHNTLGRYPVGLTLAGRGAGGTGIHDLSIRGNVFYDWGGGMAVEGDASQLTGILLEANDVQEPRLDVLLDVPDPAGLAGVRWSANRMHARRAPGGAWVRIGQTQPPPAQWPPSLSALALDAKPAAYPEPQRDVPSYCHSLGRDASFDAFIEQARAQSRSRWLPEFTAAAANRYLREGFGLSEP